jgi:hypothetical protein
MPILNMLFLEGVKNVEARLYDLYKQEDIRAKQMIREASSEKQALPSNYWHSRERAFQKYLAVSRMREAMEELEEQFKLEREEKEREEKEKENEND